MNLQIARIRLVSVGPEPARFDPLELDLRKPDQSGPADTVLFLPNTGGKTVLLRLIFSVLHPPIVEKIGAEETAHRKKNLLGYLLDRDTAHVIIEWRRVSEGRFVDDEALITALVAEWRDGRRPADPKPEDLKRLWYSIRGPVGVVGADRLILDVAASEESELGRRRLPLLRYREQLEELKKSAGRARIEVSATNVQRDWVDHLDKLGLDRALFRYQGEMNHNEAGASAIARFREDRDFIQFFLEAVFDPDELAGLDREFHEVADKVRRFPEYERRLRFEQAALSELDPLVGLIGALAIARTEAETARASALALVASFSEAERLARIREQNQRQRSRDQDAEARRLTADADRLRDEWRELRRLGAAFAMTDATQRHKSAAQRVEQADLDLRAWAVTEELVHLREALATVHVLDVEYLAEMTRLRPLQTARDEAAVTLSRHLVARAVVAEGDASAARARGKQAKSSEAMARVAERDAYIEITKSDTLRAADERRCEEVAARRQRLVVKGSVRVDERSDEARDRHATAAEAALARIGDVEREGAELEVERGLLDEDERRATRRGLEIGALHARLSADVERAERERRELGADPLVVELVETPDADLELLAPAIAERALKHAKEADSDRLKTELEGIDDRRAIRGIEETGLLPPTPAIEAVLTRLAAAGIIGRAGTHYVAEAIGRERRPTVLANRADLVGGVILAEPTDLASAREMLVQASLEPAAIVTVGVAGDVVASELESMRTDSFVVPPSAAVWDRAAARVEGELREQRLSSLDERRAMLDERGTRARRLAEALSHHASAYPRGWLSMHIAERDALRDESLRIDEARRARDVRRDAIVASVKTLRAEEASLQKTFREAGQHVDELQRLVDDELAICDLPAAIERYRVDAEHWRAIAEESAQAAVAANGAADREARAAMDYQAAAERLRSECSQIALVQAVPEPTSQDARRLVAAEADLIEFRTRFRELDRQLDRETSVSGMAARRTAAIEQRDKIEELIRTYPTSTRQRAEVLLRAPDAGELAGRRAGAERAHAEADSARADERDAYVEKQRASGVLADVEEEIRTSRRTAKIADDRAPRDRHHAARLAADARQHAEQIQGQVAVAERERNTARDEADRAKGFADGLGVLATQLKMSLKMPVGALIPTVAPFDGDAERANETGLAMARRLTSATDAEREAEQAWRERDGCVRTLLAREEFADLAASDRLYRRLAQSPAESLARDAGELVAELRASIGVLQAELATLEEDRKLATTSLAKSVNKALSYLRLAETRSRMPAHLREWSGQSFLEVRFDKPLAEELEIRLRTFVSLVLEPKSDRPTGSKLLMQALDRAVGECRVRILKPNEAFAPIRVHVAELSSPTFSNGQRATVATALMLMFSELRRQSRSSARDASVGTLILDNPLGNANAGFLIEVQRTVAAAAGIQLIYTTGIADMNALRRFTNVIGLSNDAARRTMRRYVRANPALLAQLAPAEEGAGGRVSARRVVAITRPDARDR